MAWHRRGRRWCRAWGRRQRRPCRTLSRLRIDDDHLAARPRDGHAMRLEYPELFAIGHGCFVVGVEHTVNVQEDVAVGAVAVRARCGCRSMPSIPGCSNPVWGQAGELFAPARKRLVAVSGRRRCGDAAADHRAPSQQAERTPAGPRAHPATHRDWSVLIAPTVCESSN